MNTKPSEIFEGENSSLRKTFNSATMDDGINDNKILTIPTMNTNEIKEKPKLVEDYYNKPMFNWFYKWYAIEHRNVNEFFLGAQYPNRVSWVLWKSKTTGKIIKKNYNFQIDIDKC